jgi:hypothetical protein
MNKISKMLFLGFFGINIFNDVYCSNNFKYSKEEKENYNLKKMKQIAGEQVLQIQKIIKQSKIETKVLKIIIKRIEKKYKKLKNKNIAKNKKRE